MSAGTISNILWEMDLKSKQMDLKRSQYIDTTIPMVRTNGQIYQDNHTTHLMLIFVDSCFLSNFLNVIFPERKNVLNKTKAFCL